jgi:predicted dienelactone hydrolase
MPRAKEAATGGTAKPAAPYAQRGPHAVGVRDLLSDGESQLTMTLWYPALPGAGQKTVDSYPYKVKMPAPLGAMTIARMTGAATRAAPYDPAAAPYPLVILSPGFALGRTAYAWLGEHLASHGFAVIAPAHQEWFDLTMGQFWQGAVRRPQDVQTLLAYATAQAGAGGALAGLIDPDLVAVVGHSYGGYTALAAAGARLDTDSFAARCATARATDDPNLWLCDMILPHVPEIAALAGLAAVPAGLWPVTWGDARIDAIVPMAGDAYLFDRDGLAAVTVPVLAIGGTGDDDTPYLWGTHPTYEFVSSARKARVALNGAAHMIFTSTCAATSWVADTVFKEFCADPLWDRNRAHELINHFTTAFLLAELKHDGAAAAALAPGAVTFPGVTYDASGY